MHVAIASPRDLHYLGLATFRELSPVLGTCYVGRTKYL